MQYVNKSFTLPATTKKMTDEEYEIARQTVAVVAGE